MIDGAKIKARRKKLGMNQKQLAEGICTQGVISKIERNELVPSAHLLKNIMERLDLTEEELHTTRIAFEHEQEIEILERMILRFHQNKDYAAIPELIAQNQHLINEAVEHSIHFEYFFKWINVELDYHLENNPERAIRALNRLDWEEATIENELKAQILIGLGEMHYSLENYDMSYDYYEQAKKYVNKNLNYRTHIRYLYNYSLVLTIKEAYEEALLICTEALDVLVAHDSMYLLGHIYYQIGYICMGLHIYNRSLQAFKYALALFEIKNVTKMITSTNIAIVMVQKKLDEQEDKDK